MNFFKKSTRFIFKIPIYIYKGLISPLVPHTCRFYPTCSSYTIEAIEKFGIIKGIALGVKRIARCNPGNKNCGYDPLPINIKGESKWLL